MSSWKKNRFHSFFKTENQEFLKKEYTFFNAMLSDPSHLFRHAVCSCKNGSPRIIVCLKGEKFCSLVLEAFQSTSCFTAWISALFLVAELDNAMQFSNMLGPSESVRVPVA